MVAHQNGHTEMVANQNGSTVSHQNGGPYKGSINWTSNLLHSYSAFNTAVGNMKEFIERESMLDQWLSLWFLSQLLDALKYLSRKNVLHEDIKGTLRRIAV